MTVDTNVTLQKDMFEQLARFKEADEHTAKYARFVPRRDKILVQVFKFVPSDSNVKLGKSSILMVSPLDGKLKPSSVAKAEKIFPIIKVLKKGHEAPDWVEVGALYTVPWNDVVGETWNPDFQWMMQNFSKKSNDGKPSMVTIPEDMPQKLSKLDVQWERYKFSMPDSIGEEASEDKLVYLIPTMKIEADYLV